MGFEPTASGMKSYHAFKFGGGVHFKSNVSNLETFDLPKHLYEVNLLWP